MLLSILGNPEITTELNRRRLRKLRNRTWIASVCQCIAEPKLQETIVETTPEKQPCNTAVFARDHTATTTNFAISNSYRIHLPKRDINTLC